MSVERRQGRGRLSSIDTLPDEAEEAIVWALDQLRERKLPQNVILAEFNERLLDLNLQHSFDSPIEPISKSAFNRYSVRKAQQFRRLDEVQRIGRELVGSMDAKDPDDVTIAVAELLKVSIFEILERGSNLDTKGIMEMSRALQSSVSAQKASAEYRERLQREMAKAADQMENVASQAGLTPETIAKLRRDFLGVRKASSE